MIRVVLLCLLFGSAAAELPDPALSPAQAAEDVRLLRLALEQTHPGYGRYTPVADMQSALLALETRVADGIQVNELYVETSRLLALLRCDHTKAEIPKPLGAYRDSEPSYLPLQGKLLDGRFHAWHSGVNGIGRGDEIVAINGRPMAAIIEDILPLIAFDGYTEHARQTSFGRTSELKGGALDHFLPLLYGTTRNFDIEIVTASGERQQILVDALTYPDWLALDPASKVRYRNFSDPDAVRLEFPAEGVATLAVETFVNYRTPVNPDELYLELMTQVEAAGSDTLVLDLRENGGGSEDASIGLLRFLMDRPFRVYREKQVKSIDHGELRAHYGTWEQSALDPDPEGFDRIENGNYRLKAEYGGAELRELEPAEQAFKGRLIVLTSRANSSGSTALMTVLRQRVNTIFVGGVTGGNPDGTTAGILFFLALPNSGITVRVPWFLHIPDSDVRYGGKGLEPDVSVDVTIAELVSGRDPILERAIELAIDP